MKKTKSVEEEIQNTLSTLSFNKLRGYQAVDDKVIHDAVASLNKKAGTSKRKKELEHYISDNVEFLKKLSNPQLQQEVIDLMKKENLTPYEAYRQLKY